MDAAVGAVVDQIVTGLVTPIKHQFNYLSQYRDNIHNLSSKVEILEDRKVVVQDKVDEARRNLQDIRDGVKEWLEDVRVLKAGAEKIFEEKDKVGNGCWKGWCLNLNLRYKLSRKAVKEAPQIDALLAKGYQFETVSRPQPPSAVVLNASSITASSSSGVGGGLELRLSTLRDVMEAVYDDKIRMVRICGMGGVGKTTMVNYVNKLAREEGHFDEIPIVKFTENPNFGHIQGNLAKSLGLLDLENVKEVSERALLIHRRLNDETKKILLIADNVWKREDLEGVGILGEDEDYGCKILLTSRKDEVCEKLTIEKVFKIETLPFHEAWKLFRHSLGNAHSYDGVAKDIVEACAGLPLAIKTIARALANKSETAWRVTLRGLQNPNSTSTGEYKVVFDTLKLSYDFLSTKEIKKLFRVCCLFGKGADVPIEYMARYGIALRLFSSTGTLYEEREQAQADIEALVLSNLLLVGDKVGCVKMHDIVYDFAVSLSSEGAFMVKHGEGIKEWPYSDNFENYTAIALKCGQLNELPDGLNCSSLEALQLVGEGAWCPMIKFPENFYEGMVRLRVLVLEAMDPRLNVKSLRNLGNLRFLCLDSCELNEDISMIENLDKLEVLDLSNSNLKELPTEIGKLRRLRLLDLTNCRFRLIAPGIISCLTSLEELYMEGNPWNGNLFEAMFTEICSLPKLVVIAIKMPSMFLPPGDSIFEKVERFRISCRCSLKSDIVFPIQNALAINSVGNVLLDGRMKVLLGKTEIMDLSRIEGLEVLVDESKIDQFSNVKILKAKRCSELVYLFNTRRLHQYNVFPMLNSLILKRLENLKDIFCVKESFNEFIPEEVQNLLTVPTQLASFGRLKVLEVSECDKLESIVPLPIARALVMVERLRIHGCEMMTEIFGTDEKSSIVKLELPNLKYLTLANLPNLVGFCKTTVVVDLPQLEELKVDSLEKLTSLCPETENSASEHDHVSASLPLFIQKGPLVWGFKNLRSLKVNGCSSLRILFTYSVAITLRELHSLEIESCEFLEAIVSVEFVMEETILFPKLTGLSLIDLPKLSTLIPEGCTFMWSLLKTVRVGGCGDVFGNTNIIQKGTDLEKMPLTSTSYGNYQMNATEQFSGASSHKLNLDTSSVLFSYDLVRRCHQLEKLDVLESDFFEAVFDLEEELIVGGQEHNLVILGRLEYLKVSNLPMMTHVWKKFSPSLQGFHNLTCLNVSICNNLRYLFATSIAKCLVKLQIVRIDNCERIEEVVSLRDEVECLKNSDDNISLLKSEMLDLTDLPSLISLGPGVYAPEDANTSISSPIIDKKISLTRELRRDNFAVCRRYSYGWKEIRLWSCKNLTVVFSSNLIQGFHDRLEYLDIRYCESLEVVFDLEKSLVIGGEVINRRLILNQMRKIYLFSVPMMTHVWKNCPPDFKGFHNLTRVKVEWCGSLRYLFSPSIAKCIGKLQKLTIRHCEVMEQVFSNQGNEDVRTSEAEQDLDGNATSTSSSIYNDKSSDYHSSALVGMGPCQFLTLSFHSLTSLEVHACDRMSHIFQPNIAATLPVLQTLSIRECYNLRYIFCSSSVRSLMQLREFEIYDCEMLDFIVKEEDEEAESYDKTSKPVGFPSLISMKLTTLPNLRAISSGRLAFDWSSLTSLEINDCWNMRIFTSGCSTTPILDTVILNEEELSLEGDLNATFKIVQQKDIVAFKDTSVLTNTGFLVSGDHLTAQCPSWSWGNYVNSLGLSCYNRQYLITRNVLCLTRARVSSRKENEADECVTNSIRIDEENTPNRPRTYDINITYDETYKNPCLWLTGYDAESKTPLPQELVLEDIAESYPRELVTYETHPYLDESHVRLYTSLTPSFIKDCCNQPGFQPDVCHYLQLLLRFYAHVIPTIQYRFC